MSSLARSCAAAAAVALGVFAGPAESSLVLVAPEDLAATVLTVLTLQSPGSSSFEAGSVGRVEGIASDAILGDAKTGSDKTLTRSLSSLGISSAADLRVAFKALEPGNDAKDISLIDLQLSIFSPSGTLLFASGEFAPIHFADTTTGAGSAGFVFGLDNSQALQAQALAFGDDFGNNLIGLSASIANATGGAETFYAGHGGVMSPVPEPQTYALMLSGLVTLWLVRRGRGRQSTQRG
jgi:hypothetical protein